MGAGEKIVEYAKDQEMKARVKFANWVANEENIEFSDAWLICTNEDPERVIPEYSLGWKLASPLVQTELNLQPSKRARAAAREKFRSGLTPAEQKLFDEQVDGGMIRKAIIAKVKRRTKKSTTAEEKDGSSPKDPAEKNDE